MTEADIESLIEVAERSLRDNGEGALVAILAKDLIELLDAAMRMTVGLRDAIPHVYRQQFAGKHEQDREDARKWLTEFTELRRAITGDVT